MQDATEARHGTTQGFADTGGAVLRYEEWGNREDETVLLVMGLGMQMVAWREGFCQGLVDRGFHVVRYDNRDVGESTWFPGRVNVYAGLLGLTRSAPYTLDGLAGDAAALLNHLEIDSAHLVGASMGGMIAQKLSAHRPERVRSLCSIMSSTGRTRPATLPRPAALRVLLQRPAQTRDEFVEGMVSAFDVIGSPGYPSDPDGVREVARRSWNRGYNPLAGAHHLMAVLASGNRTAELARVRAPTLVVHGAADRLVPSEAGREVAAAIEGARLELIGGMGHDLPVEAWPRVLDLIESHARSA